MTRWKWWVMAFGIFVAACGGEATGVERRGKPDGFSGSAGAGGVSSGGRTSSGGASPAGAAPSAGGAPAMGGASPAGGTPATGGTMSEPHTGNWSETDMCWPAVGRDGAKPAPNCPCLDEQLSMADQSCSTIGQICEYDHGQRCWVAYCKCMTLPDGRIAWACPSLLC